jgi:hypothetical protein
MAGAEGQGVHDASLVVLKTRRNGPSELGSSPGNHVVAAPSSIAILSTTHQGAAPDAVNNLAGNLS